MLMCILEFLGCYDQCNLPQLLGVEILCRRAQLIESAFELSKDGKTPDFFHAEDMMGLSNQQSGAVVSSSLERATAERLKARAEIAKEVRKARANTQPKGGKKGRKGDQDDD